MWLWLPIVRTPAWNIIEHMLQGAALACPARADYPPLLISQNGFIASNGHLRAWLSRFILPFSRFDMISKPSRSLSGPSLSVPSHQGSHSVAVAGLSGPLSGCLSPGKVPGTVRFGGGYSGECGVLSRAISSLTASGNRHRGAAAVRSTAR